MNRERKIQALRRNIDLTRGALEHANELKKRGDPSVTAFPAKTEEFINEMNRKLSGFEQELKELESVG